MKPYHHYQMQYIPSKFNYKCILCGENANQMAVQGGLVNRYFQGGIYYFHRCPSCEFRAFYPIPSQESIEEQYKNEPAEFLKNEDVFSSMLRSKSMLSYMREFVAWVLDHSPNIRSSSDVRAIDIGSRNGELLNYCKSLGWDITGVEPDPILCNMSTEKIGCKMICAMMNDDSVMNSGQYDVIFMVQTLEHHHNPVESLKIARDLLKPSGRIYIEVPNTDGIVPRSDINQWDAFLFPHHLNYFNKASLIKASEISGLNIIEAETYTPNYDVPLVSEMINMMNIREGRMLNLDKLAQNNLGSQIRIICERGN